MAAAPGRAMRGVVLFALLARAGGSAEPPPRFLVSIFTLGYYTAGCNELKVECPFQFWMQRADLLGATLQRASRRAAAIDVFVNCREAGERRTRRGVTVRTHGSLPSELEALRAPFVHAPLPPYWIITLKWVALSLVDVEFVVSLDMDMEMLPASLQPYADEVAADWLGFFARMRAAGVRAASLPDNSAPMNTGFMILRPDLELYRDGVALLQRAEGAFNRTHGWELLGPPRDVVPATDSSWHGGANGRPHHSLEHNVWDFVGADIDQGFFFHMLRVRHQVGVDINQMPELPLDAWPRVAGRDGPPEHRYRLGHFFNKPFARSVPRPPCRQYVKRRKPDKVKHQLAKQLAWNIEASAALAATNDDAVVAADVRARCLRAWNGTRMCIRLLIHGHGIEPSFIEKHATLDSLYHPREMLAGPRQPAGLRRRPNGAARHPALQGGQHR